MSKKYTFNLGDEKDKQDLKKLFDEKEKSENGEKETGKCEIIPD